jgi:hypothetical protein
MSWHYDISSKVSFYFHFMSKLKCLYWRDTANCHFSCDCTHCSIGDHIIYVDEIWIDRDDKCLYMEINGGWEYISAFILYCEGIWQTF